MVAAVEAWNGWSGLGTTCTTPLKKRCTEGRDGSRCNMVTHPDGPLRTVLLVVVVEERGAELHGVLDRFELLGERGTVLQSLELRLGKPPPTATPGPPAAPHAPQLRKPTTTYSS